MEKINHVFHIVRKYFAWIPDEDIKQTVWLAYFELQAQSNSEFSIHISEIRRRTVSLLEKLSRNMGYKKAKINGKRMWLSESLYLEKLISGEIKRVGAPLGNKNRAAKQRK